MNVLAGYAFSVDLECYANPAWFCGRGRGRSWFAVVGERGWEGKLVSIIALSAGAEGRYFSTNGSVTCGCSDF